MPFCGALAKSPFGKPVHLESSEGARTVKGEVYAVVDYPFAAVDEGLRAKVTLRLRDKTLGDVLDVICRLTGTKVVKTEDGNVLKKR